jgi:serine protease
MKRLLLSVCLCLSLGWVLASWITSWTVTLFDGGYTSIVINFRDDIGQGQIRAQLDQIATTYKVRPRLNSEFSEVDQVYVMEGDRIRLDQLQRSSLAKSTEFIEPNYLYTIPEASQANWPIPPDQAAKSSQNTTFPNDPLYPQQWNLQQIQVAPVWQQQATGKGITVAIVDTGIAKVPDLAEEQLVRGYDFINDETYGSDDHGHGTHIAGIIAQATNNQYGAAGIAYEASLMPIKVLAVGGSGTVADIAEGIRLAADRGAQVINLSLVGTGYSQLLQAAIDYAHRKGVVIVAPAGNSKQNTVMYPARYRHVIGVAALDAAAQKAPYSNFGPGVDLAAPGGVVTQAAPLGGIIQNTLDPRTKQPLFTAYQGSSFAVAHVTGAVALLQSIQQSLPPEQIEAILAQTATKVPKDPLNQFGEGKLNVLAAVNMVQQHHLPPVGLIRWLNHQGYFRSQLWLDPQGVTLHPKFEILLAALALALIVQFRFVVRWNIWFIGGLIVSSGGLFVLQGIYFYDLPPGLLDGLGRSLPEFGSVRTETLTLNPLWASVLPPALLWLVLGRQPRTGWLAAGVSLGMVPGLLGQVWMTPAVIGLGQGLMAQLFLCLHAVLSAGLSLMMLGNTAAQHRQRHPRSPVPRPVTSKPSRQDPLSASQSSAKPVDISNPSP